MILFRRSVLAVAIVLCAAIATRSEYTSIPPTSVSSIYCNTVGYFLVRLLGAWTCAQGLPVNIAWFGTTGDGAANDTPYVQAAITAAGNNPIFCPRGDYRIIAALTSSSPINLSGPGAMFGPGVFATNQQSCRFIMDSSGIDLFQITSIYGSVISNVAVRKPSPSAGIAFNLISQAGVNLVGPRFYNIGCSLVDTCIKIQNPGWPLITGSHFGEWTTAGIVLVTDPGLESSGGWITNNDFNANNSGGACLYSEVGYITFYKNVCVGGDYGVDYSFQNSPAGFSQTNGNVFENQHIWNTRYRTLDGSVHNHLFYYDNEAGGVPPSGGIAGGSLLIEDWNSTPTKEWVSNVFVHHNLFAPVYNSGGHSFVWLRAGKNVHFDHNTIRHDGSGTQIAVNISGTATQAGIKAPFYVTDNQRVNPGSGSFSILYSINGGPVVLRDMQGMAFADLPAAANLADGSQIYVNDAQVATPCVDGGGGATAIKGAGVLRCY